MLGRGAIGGGQSYAHDKRMQIFRRENLRGVRHEFMSNVRVPQRIGRQEIALADEENNYLKSEREGQRQPWTSLQS